VPKTSSIRSAVSIEHRLVTDTDGHRDMASTADAQRRAVKIDISADVYLNGGIIMPVMPRTSIAEVNNT